MDMVRSPEATPCAITTASRGDRPRDQARDPPRQRHRDGYGGRDETRQRPHRAAIHRAHILLGKIRGLPVEIGERAQGAGHGIESLLRRPEEHPGRFGPRIGRQREQPGLRLRIGIACGAVLAEQALLLAGRDQGA
ncbi:hypothetical protein [Paracidovorax citrulli]|uniref:hypothetical protein n=1 Tax=Paracidovorax citrulli TaxID=80869 RepID=UPI003632E124